MFEERGKRLTEPGAIEILLEGPVVGLDVLPAGHERYAARPVELVAIERGEGDHGAAVRQDAPRAHRQPPGPQEAAEADQPFEGLVHCFFSTTSRSRPRISFWSS